MKIIKRVQGHDIVLDYKRVKSYPHGFIRFRVYKMLGKYKRVFLYNTCLTSLDIKRIKRNGYQINEEVNICML
ncbi:MAG: hypothetical protein J6Y29_03885 [Clostridiales bacterium]|nr:hypothetical protein [Clostridiales bacterium]